MAKNDMVALRLSEAQSAKLDALCDSAQMDRSSMIRLLIDSATVAVPAQVFFDASDTASVTEPANVRNCDQSQER